MTHISRSEETEARRGEVRGKQQGPGWAVEGGQQNLLQSRHQEPDAEQERSSHYLLWFYCLPPLWPQGLDALA